ncbi:phage tail protein I [Salibacterium halotolerans]|uniref:Phage tail protein, P2 protein I family n=1 Tax=Salibacterium halotolerans TaxID=1884432 RepID=A0A1I5MPV2_9BACI|nr:phage tail protein I [Salibacterium halotolerans]SFP11589.1 phage tail protein, P2 protein I family [Salibacterium halotolerans]
MTELQNSNVIDLLPPNLKNDPDIKAASKVINQTFKDTVEKTNPLKLYVNIQDQPDEVLDHLLWQSHVTFSEGSGLAETREEKINLIENSEYIHNIKGTPAALERVLELLNMDGKVTEWFNYGGDPYFFRIDIQVKNKGLSENNITLLENLITAFKNNRSWVDVINFYLVSNAKVHLASLSYFGEEITVYPWQQTEVQGHAVARLGSGSRSTETTTIYPKG